MSNTHNSTSVRLRVGDGSGLPAIIEGISPEVELTEVEAGVRMDVTTKSGTKSALIPKGEPGEDYILTDDDKEDIAELFSYIRQDAETAAAAAAESESNAGQSAEDAAASAQAAAASAEDAAGSETAAAGSATAAAGSASSASGSASSASSSNAAAAGFASAAESSAQQASNSAVVARTQANTARTQATNAASSATAAANSATAAAGSASTATNQATAAANSATAAAGSASAAAQSATDAQAAADELEDTIQDVADLETEVSNLNSAFDLLAYSNVNLFDKTAATVGKVLSDGTEVTAVNGFYSDYIPITPGEFLVPKGVSTGASYIQLYNSSKSYVGSAPATDLNNGLLKYTINSAIVAYVRFNNDKRQINNVMFVKGESFPDAYVPYQSAILKNDIPLSAAQKKYVDDSINVITEELPNMFDKTSSGILNGYYSNSTFVENANYRMTHPIYVENGKTYKYPHSPNLSANYAVAKLDSEFNFTGGNIVGTFSNGIVTFTSDADTYVRLNIGTVKYLDRFFCIEEEKYIGQFEPYGDVLGKQIYPNSFFNTPNLFNKRVVFDGDSICYGAGDTVGRGYGSRIGGANEMVWANVGVSGGTIAVVSGVSHNLCTYIDTIHQNYPELDYLILEGGTNDADRLLMEGIGTLTGIDDFSGNYDTGTFYGAMETLLYKAISYYPTAKIGYIVAPKMPIWVESQGKFVLPTRRIEFFKAAMLACEKWGIPYLDLWDGCAMNSSLSVYFDRSMTAEQNLAAGKMYADQQHPNANGYDYIYPTIARWMNTL